MSQSLSANLKIVLNAIQSIIDDEFGTPTDNPAFSFPVLSFTNGTGANQADILYHGRTSIAGTTGTTIDLNDATGASLVNRFGTAVQCARIKLFAFYNRSSDPTDICALGGGSNAFEGWTTQAGSKITLAPGGLALLVAPTAAGYVVTGGTGDKIKIVNGATNTISIDTFLLGASA